MWFLLVAEAAKENKIHPDDVRKAFQGSRSELLHQVFHFRIQHYILGKSPVCDFRPAIVSLTHWHALCSQSAAVRCIYVCVCVCCCVYVVLGFDSLPLSLLLLCTCSLSPISRFVFVCPPSEWEQLSLSASSRVYMTVAFSWGLFFPSFFVVMFRLRKQPSPFLCMSETAGEKNKHSVFYTHSHRGPPLPGLKQ